MKNLFNPDGGDLGQAFENTPVEQIPFLTRRITQLFSSLLEIRPHDLELVYCIQFNSDYKTLVGFMLRDIEKANLPRGVHIYECDGNKIFDMRGRTGGVVVSCCFYIITMGER